MEEAVDGDQARRPGQVGTGESNSPNQIAEEGDGRMTGRMEAETQGGIQVGVVGAAGMRVLLGEPGEQVAQEEEEVVEEEEEEGEGEEEEEEEGGWVLLGAWGPNPIKVGVEETKCTRCQTASRVPSQLRRHSSNNHSPAISIRRDSQRWTKGRCKGSGVGNPSLKPRIRTKTQAGPQGPFLAAPVEVEVEVEVEVDLNQADGRNPRRSL
ncbi:hypothetical protein EYF80_051009 [Liparis tanakae]|uniref:Uncharacterized protein n=1 Tax=Liparis tanakae TaxID=230148 RepID=A0A4Z2FD62_9TELE|nr:hypothetical protein EYF80_051009 [Liparis tanakae]